MDIDFNNVQDQNLIDDSIVDDISQDANQVNPVGSVVHPGDKTQAEPPAAPTPPVPPAPNPTNDEPKVPTAQEILGESADLDTEEPLPNMNATQTDQTDQSDDQTPPENADNEAPAEAQPEEAEPTVAEADIPEPEIQAPQEEPAETENNETEQVEEALVPAPEETMPQPSAEEEQPQEETEEPVQEPAEQPPEENQEDAPEADQQPYTAPVLGEGVGDDEELMGVKQQALEELSPLVDHLDLPPEQKFDTYMEILRASDDKTLVKPAFAAAKAIEDEDKRAQALLDVVNEVNYLTQDHTDAN